MVLSTGEELVSSIAHTEVYHRLQKFLLYMWSMERGWCSSVELTERNITTNTSDSTAYTLISLIFIFPLKTFYCQIQFSSVIHMHWMQKASLHPSTFIVVIDFLSVT